MARNDQSLEVELKGVSPLGLLLTKGARKTPNQPLPFLFITQRQAECSLLFAFFPVENQASDAPSFRESVSSKNKPLDTSNTLYK